MSDIGSVKVSLNATEVYLKGQDVKGAIEYKRDCIVACVDMDPNIFLIDRKQKAVVRTIANPGHCENPLALRLFPQYDCEKLPFAMLRDKDGITLIGLGAN